MTAETIKQLREARGWTQAELARRLNISSVYPDIKIRVFIPKKGLYRFSFLQ